MFYTLYSRFTEKSPTPRKKLRKKNVLHQIDQKSNFPHGTDFKRKATSHERLPSNFLPQKKGNPPRGIAFKEVARLEGVEPPTF